MQSYMSPTSSQRQGGSNLAVNSFLNDSRFSNGSYQAQHGEELAERYNQACGSFQFLSMVVLMALSLIPSLIMLGGYKFVIYLALDRHDSSESLVAQEDFSLDMNMTMYGIGAAFLLFIGR